MSAAFAASMQLIPSCTSTSTPSMVIFAIRVLGAPKRNAESAPRILRIESAAGEISRERIRESFHKRGEYSRGRGASMTADENATERWRPRRLAGRPSRRPSRSEADGHHFRAAAFGSEDAADPAGVTPAFRL